MAMQVSQAHETIQRETVVFSPRQSIVPPGPLTETEVHLWATSTNDGRWSLGEVLGAAERERAERFKNQHDRERFVASHTFLRHVLAAYLETGPADLEFGASDRGKPFLLRHDDFHFNLSHAGDMVACVAGRSPLGIDIEATRAVSDLDSIVSRWFTDRERAVVQALPPDRRTQAFLEIWTRKEAVLKAEGIGLAGISDEMLEAKWSVRSFEFDAGVVGAVAVSPLVCSVTAQFIEPSQPR